VLLVLAVDRQQVGRHRLKRGRGHRHIVEPAAAAPALAQSGNNVLLVVNDASPVSATIADHYARARGVPQDNRVHINVDAKDDIARADYVRLIETPLAQWFARNSSQVSPSVKIA